MMKLKFRCRSCDVYFGKKSCYFDHRRKEHSSKVTRSVKIKLHKPFLKWVGGKTQIINDVIKKFPKQMNNYHELFLGGGSVLFALLTLEKNKKIQITGNIYASDFNKTLISVYKAIQNDADTLYDYIIRYITTYDSIVGDVVNRNATNLTEAKTSKESYYYWMRKKFNTGEKTLEHYALFIVLNKTCFRGVYREGPNGFNVPYGHYKTTPRIFTRDELHEIKDLIANVKFQHCSFEQSIKKVQPGDFVYMDPPYAKETTTSFDTYVKQGFPLELHKKLFDRIKNLDKCNIKFLLSNAKVKIVTDTFKDFSIQDVKARRAINSKKPEATTMEVLISN